MFIVNETAKLQLEDFSELYSLKIILFIISLINSLILYLFIFSGKETKYLSNI